MSAPGLRLNTAADHAAARAAQDKRNYGRKWGRAFRGERTTTRAVFVRGKRFSLVPVLSYYGLLDWYIVEGGLDAARFLDFVQRCVARDPPPPAGARARSPARVQVPLLQPYPSPHSVVVMDNFVTHHNTEVLAEIEAAGALVHHTPPYSPDMTPIELPFAKIKAYLRGAQRERLEAVRQPELWRVCAARRSRTRGADGSD